MNKIKKISAEAMKYIIFIVASTIWLIFMLFAMNYSVFASTTDHSDVLEDLRVDETFDFNNYPSYTYEEIDLLNNDTDTTNDVPLLSVINIGESTTSNLIIYVYQPTNGNLDLNGIKISIDSNFSSNGENLNPFLYELELVSTYSVFNKYIVKDYTISSEAYRYYNLVSIYRDYNENIDEELTGGYKDGIAHNVGQQWCLYYYNDVLKYEMNTFNTIELNIDYIDFLEFNNGLMLKDFFSNFEWGRMHFIVFSCEDYIIKKIYDAKMTYIPVKVVETWQMGVGTEYYKTEEDIVYYELTDVDVGTFEGEGLLAKKYSWNRISTSTEFIENMENQDIEFTEECKTEVLNSQWVFAFAETEYTTTSYDGGYTNKYYEITDTSILRLHFMDVNNRVYNLGVVADLVSADNVAGGLGSGLDLDIFEEMFQKIMMLIGIIVLIVLLCVCAPLLNIIITVGKVLFKAIGFVISLPFKLIGGLFGSKKKF